MKTWKKGLLIIVLLVGLNFTLIPAILPQWFKSKGVIVTDTENPTIGTAIDVSVPGVGADYVWMNLTGPGNEPLTGDGVLVGIVDTGVDWKHPDFFHPEDSRVEIVAGIMTGYAADVSNNGLGEPIEDLYTLDSADGPAGWDAYYDWLFVDRNANMAYDYGTDWYAIAYDEDEQGDLDIGETVVMLRDSKILEIIDMTTGSNWTATDIESGVCTHIDSDGHGTHVAGIAVGGQLKQNGSRFHSFTGVAPGADLIVVKIGENTSQLYNDASLYQAIQILAQKDVDVISLSLGAYMWRHLDGTSAVEQLIDSLDIPVVVAAGNLQNKFVHQEAPVSGTPGFATPVPFEVSHYGLEPNNIRLSVIWNQTGLLMDFNLSYYGLPPEWYPWIGAGGPVIPFPIGWSTYDNISLPNPNPSLQTVFFPRFGMQVDYWLSTSARTRMLCINITPGGGVILPGTYSLDIYNSSVDHSVQCYVWDNGNQFVNNTGYPFPPFTIPSWVIFGYEMTPPPNPQIFITATPEYTVMHPATANTSIAVGSFDLATGALSKFSSRGSPAYDSFMDGYQKPDLCAPGADTNTFGINSSVSRDAMGAILGDWISHISAYQGTSQAAPHVAGAIALMLQKNSTLSVSQIKTILRNTTVRDGFVGAVPNYSWGFGKLNISAAVQMVEMPPLAPVLQPLTANGYKVYLNWTDVLNVTTYYIYRNTSIITNITGLIPIATCTTNYTNDLAPSYDTYYYVIVASNIHGNSSPSNCENITILPAPVLQPLTANGYTVYLNWTNIIGAIIYYIYRDTSNITDISGLAPIGTSTTNYTSDLVLSLGTYFYVIVASNGYANSSISNCENVTLLSMDTPPGGLPWWIWVILVGLIIAVVVVIVVMRKKKKRGA